MAEKFTGYLVKVYTDRNIYSLTYGDERKDMEYNPTVCPPDAPVPPQPEPEKKIPQTIVWEQDFREFYVGDEIELSAYATSGLAVSYRIEEGSRIAHLNGNRLTADAEGGIIVMATQGGNETYYSADNVLKPINIKEQPQPIVKKEQTITWTQVIDLHEGEEIVLNATATSGLPVQFTIVEGMENARLIGNTLYGVNNGNVSVRAYQLGNDEWKEAEPITKPIYIQKKEEPIPPTPTKEDQTIVWDETISLKVGDVISLSAYATSGLPIQYIVTLGNELVSINGNELTALGEGPVMIKAEQGGNDDFNAAEPKVKAFTIEKKDEIGGYLVVQFDKNYVDPLDRPYSTIQVILPQDSKMRMSEVLWETDDLKTYLANAVDPMGDGIVTLEVPFKKLHGDFQKEAVCTMNSTEIDNGCDYVVAAYLIRDYKKDYIDFEEVTSLSCSFRNLENVGSAVFRIVDNNIRNTQNVTSLYAMFECNNNMTFAHLSNLDFSNVNDYEYMFKDCYKLASIQLDNTPIKTSASYTDMFKNCGRDVPFTNVWMNGATTEMVEFIKKAWVASDNDINKLSIHM